MGPWRWWDGKGGVGSECKQTKMRERERGERESEGRERERERL